MNLKEEAKIIFNGIVSRHRGRLPGKVVLTRYESEKLYRKLRPNDELTKEQQERLTDHVADLFCAQSVSIEFQTLTEADYLTELDAEGKVDTPDNRAEFAIRRRGAPPGNVNAMLGFAPKDRQLTIRCTEAEERRWKALPRKTRDRGFAALVRRLLEQEEERLKRP